MSFIKMNELKLTQVELFDFFHLMHVAANASELFSMAHLENNERFLFQSKVECVYPLLYREKKVCRLLQNNRIHNRGIYYYLMCILLEKSHIFL